MSKSKSILILANNGMGLYKFRKELIEELIKNNFDVFVAMPRDEYYISISELGVTVLEIDVDRRGKNPLKDISLILSYKNIIKELKPSVVLTYTIKPNIYGGIASQLNGTPYIANITGLGTAVENPGLLQKLTVFLYRIAFKNINTIYFQNEENMTFFAERNIYINKHKLIPGSGVNLSHFKLTDYPDSKIIKFVFISRIMKEKGIDYYLEASKKIKEKYPNVEFHICGFSEEDYEKKLYEKEEKGLIKYHGMVNDIRTVIKDIHCTVHPTYYPEGLSNVLLESAAMGRPIIATDRSGCREVIDDKINGFLVKEKNTNDLVNKIETFISLTHMEKYKMGLEGRKKIEKEFSRKIIVNEYLNNIKEIMEDFR